jgi:hypothetical protein
MQRLWAIAAMALACAIAPGVAAQQVEPRGGPGCPSGAVSIYFASGEARLTAEGRQLVTRLADQAAACQHDGIDLVTLINTEVDGEHAIALSLARLDDISRDLIARGIAPESIRVAARPGRDVFPQGMSEVEMIFRKAVPAAAGEASTQRPPTPLKVSPDAI